MAVEFKKIDDVQLQQMAAEPVRPLFGVLDHAAAMIPWVILLAFLPNLYAIANRPLSDESARWGVKALKTASAHDLSEAVDPGVSDTSLPYRWQPPFISWLSGLAAWSLGTWSPSALMLGPYTATAGFLLAAYLLACRVGDVKLGLLTILMLAFHSEVLTWAQSATPFAAGLCFAVLTFWSYLGHLKNSETVTSADLLATGVFLGVCLLAGGPLAIVVLITLVLHTLALKFPIRRLTGRSEEEFSKAGNSSPSFRSLGVMTLTAFAVGGWWELMMAFSYGNSFWTAWFTGEARSAPIAPVSGAGSQLILPRDVGQLLLILAGPALYGLWRAMREIFTEDNRYKYKILLLLVLWTTVAGLTWQWARRFQTSAAVGEPLWRGFLLIPLLLLASWGVLQIADGRAGRRAVAVIGLVTAANLIWNTPSNLAGTALLKMFILMILIGALSVVASLSPGFWHHRADEGRASRHLEMTLVLMMLAGHCLSGLAAVPRTTERDQELAAVGHALSQIDQQVVDFTIISPESNRETPAQLVYLAKTIWPTARGQTVNSWEEADHWAEGGTSASSEVSHVHVFLLWQASLVPYPAADGSREIARFQEYYRHRQISVLVLPAAEF